MSIIIKNTTLFDLKKNKDRIINYIYENYKQFHNINNFTTEDSTKKYVEMFQYLEKKEAIIIGAYTKKDVLVGFLWGHAHVFREDNDRVYVTMLHVDSEHRGTQLGSKLIKKLEMVSYDKGYKSIFLHVDAYNIKGINFYNKNGFKNERLQMIKRLKDE